MPIPNGRDDRDEYGQVEGQDEAELPPVLPVGFVIGGKYQVKRVLGMGGNGAVYEGEHTDIGHRVAVKIAHRKLDDRGDVMTRFRREARICGSLRHPHVGQVFDVGTLEDGAPYMVMELQEGRSLADVIDDTTLPIAAITHITRQLLAGLGAAHQAGAIHLDIKPDNVMLVRDHGGDVVVKLVDFGISRRLNEVDQERADAEEGFIIGSPDYMPPEQLCGEQVDTRTDVYATGVLLYEAITGRTPFDAPSTAELVEAIMRDTIVPPTSLRADCPVELEQVVLKAMSRDPAERFQSADEMSRALAEVGATTRSTPSASLVPFSQQRPRHATTVRRRRTIDARMLQTLRIRKPVSGRPRQPANAAEKAATVTTAHARGVWIAAGVAGAIAGALVMGWAVTRQPSTGEGVASTPPPVALAAAPAGTHQAAAAEPSAVAVQPAAEIAPGEAAPSADTQPLPAAPEEIAQAAGATAPEDDAEEDAASERSLTPRQRAARARRARQTAARAQAAERAQAKVAEAAAPPAAAPPAEPPPPAQDLELTRAQLREAATAFNRGQSAEALSLYRKLVKVAPREPGAWRGLAASANRMAERSEAERALRRYLQLRPKARDATTVLQLKRMPL